MPGWDNELRLAGTVLLNAAVFACAFRFARRRGTNGALQAGCDAFLVYFVVQYVSVALPGAIGLLNVWTMFAVALVISALLWFAAPAPPAGIGGRRSLARDHLGFLACAAFVVAYCAVFVFDQRWSPPTATDAIVYHLPTAVQWIQTGKLGLYPTWYWNPAATYSPATSSTFMAWLMLPAGNDVFVRFVQAAPLIFVFVLAARLCREFGCSRTLAGLVGVAAALARPFFSESLIPKDDLFITAFFASAVLSLTPSNLRDRLGPWRVGLSFGMVLACKYTVLIVCPLFLFMIDAPFRAGWKKRDWAIALVVGVTLFTPWYVRNFFLTGNPLYPVDVKIFGHTVFTGMFGTERDETLRTAGGVWHMLKDTYHSLPVALVIVLAIAWGAGIAGAGRTALRDPLRRACLIGTPVTFALFVITSPHHELRYMYPLLLLLFGVIGFAVDRWVRLGGPAALRGTGFQPVFSNIEEKHGFKTPVTERRHTDESQTIFEPAQLGIGVAIAVLSLITGFKLEIAPRVALLAGEALILTMIAVPLLVSRHRNAALGLTGAIAAMVLYVFWSGYVADYYRKTSEGFGEAGLSFVWRTQYAAEEPLWTFVRENLPKNAPIAISNTYFVYPFQDARFSRRLIYAPVRRGVHDFLHFPRLGDTVPGDVIVKRMTDVMNEDPDKATWLENLKNSGAQYLVIATFKEYANPPERRFVTEEPHHFEELFNDPAGSVYRIRW